MKIAYLTNCFGIQSHTFIRREIAELNSLGIAVELFGIRRETSEKLTADERELVQPTRYLYPVNLLRLVGLHLCMAVATPQRYWPTLWIALTNSERKISRRLKLIYHFLIAPALAQQIKASGVSHIHAHFLNVSSTMAMYASLLTGIPYSVTVHSAGTRNAAHIIGISMKLRHAQFLIMISRYNIDYFDAIYPCRDKSTVIRCGMDLAAYPFREPACYLEQEAARAAPSVMAVGRMVEKKGFLYLLEAAHQLRQREVDFIVNILGTGPMEETLKAKVADLDIQNQINFFGPASTAEVRESMLAASVVVVPSVTSASGEMEGIPVVLMEAMALGVPVVATRHSGIPELVRNGDTGVVVEEKDSAGLALALQAFLENREIHNGEVSGASADLSQRLVRARALIETEFNISVVARQRQALFLHYQNISEQVQSVSG